MDPYQTLGVPRDCTRDEAKDAFRARSWQAHPDRGGDDAAFIRLYEAYKIILAELDQFPRPERPKPARDPYQTLGVPWDCTRDEVKEAFRALSWQVHPDRGGDEAAFIRLCEAYKTILADLDQFPRPERPKPARARSRRRRRTATPRPPDPNWEPELVVSDKPPPCDRPPQPFDPTWEPDLVVLDEPTRGAQPVEPIDPSDARQRYVSWLRDFTDRSTRNNGHARSSLTRAIGAIGILGTFAVGAFLCWIAWKALAQ
jgi:hypothetical protein